MKFSPFIYTQPYLCALRNNFKKGIGRHKFLIKTFSLLLFIVFILLISREHLFNRRGTSETVKAFYNYYPFILQIYWWLLLVAGSISAVFQIYQSKKTTFILSRPFNGSAFFFSAILQLILSSAFISLTIAVPLCAISAKIFGLKILFSLLPTLLLLNVSAASLSVIAALLLGPLIMHRIGRTIFLGAIFSLIFAGFLFSTRLTSQSQQEVLRQLMHSFENSSQTPVVREFFAALSKTALGTFVGLYEYFLLIITLIFPLLAGSLLTSKYFYSLYECAEKFKSINKKTKSLLLQIFSLAPFKHRTLTLIAREYQLLIRDALNIFQLLLILLVLLVYIFSLINLPSLHMAGAGSDELIKSLLIAVNYIAVMLIISVITARFVFPTFSFENGSFWMIASSPLKLTEYYHIKNLSWSIIIITIGFFGLLGSNYIILDSFRGAMLLALPGIFSIYGMISLSLGLGAYFVKLDWENITDLTSSFGNFLYLLSSFVFIILNLIPCIFLILLQAYALTGTEIEYSFSEIFYFSSIFALIVYFNLLSSRFFRQFAIRSLESKLLT